MAETEEEELDVERNANNVTMGTIFNHSTISPSNGEIRNVKSVHSTISPSQGDIASVTSERQIYSKNSGRNNKGI